MMLHMLLILTTAKIWTKELRQNAKNCVHDDKGYPQLNPLSLPKYLGSVILITFRDSLIDYN
jgi:hypothetical protein